jgi:transmembrane sensor
MAELKRPLRDCLDPAYSEEDVQRIWHGVQRRTARRPLEARARWAVRAFALAGSVVLLVLWLWPGRSAPGPLELATGEPLSSLTAAPSGAGTRVALSDGSNITLNPGARLDVLGNAGDVFYSVLRQGSSEFDVKPHGPRRWIVECGPATVEVLGTSFSCERQAGKLVVSVKRGVVLVRGATVPERVQRLTAGSSLAVAEVPAVADAAASAAPAADVPVLPVVTSSSAAPPVPSTSAAPPVSVGPSIALEQSPGHESFASTPGAFGGASPAAFGARPSSSSTRARWDTVDMLMARAEGARLRGDSVEAARQLERIVALAPHDPRAGLARMMLGRLFLGQDPERAAEHFSAASSGVVPSGLAEDALARLVEAEARAGRRERARQAAEEYQLRYPNGARRAEVRSWAGLE